MGKPVGQAMRASPISDALKGKGGAWDWDKMSAWLANPKKFAPGTKMTFAGLSNPQDRANVIAFLNAQATRPADCPPLRPTPAAADDKAAAEADDAGAQKAENEPVLNEAQAAKGGQKRMRRARPPSDSAVRRAAMVSSGAAHCIGAAGCSADLVMAADGVPRLVGRLRTQVMRSRSSGQITPSSASPWKSTTRSQNSRPNSRIGSGRTLPVWIRVSSSNISSNVPNPPGNTATARARSRKCIFLSAK